MRKRLQIHRRIKKKGVAGGDTKGWIAKSLLPKKLSANCNKGERSRGGVRPESKEHRKKEHSAIREKIIFSQRGRKGKVEPERGKGKGAHKA